MADDERLVALFRAAATDPGAPPPGFDHGDVVAASRRITARRRAAVGGALAVVAVVGLGAAVVQIGRSGGDATSTVAAPYAAPDRPGDAARDSAPEAVGAPGAQGVVPPFTGTPLGPSPQGCADRQDPALRAVVDEALPEVRGAAAAPATSDLCLPGGDRYLSLTVNDNGTAGVLIVTYLRPGAIAQLAAGAVSAPTASGGTVIVGSSPARPGGAAPFGARLDTVAAFLAPRL